MTDPSMNISVAYLADHVEHVPLVAQWLHAQFGHLSTARTLEERAARLRRSLNRQAIPTTFVALAGTTPLGTAALVASDLPPCPDLTPWLASVYVDPPYRTQGVGRALAQRVAQEATALGHSRLWLYTSNDRLRFYGLMGWRAVEQLQYGGDLMTVMALDLPTA